MPGPLLEYALTNICLELTEENSKVQETRDLLIRRRRIALGQLRKHGLTLPKKVVPYSLAELRGQ